MVAAAIEGEDGRLLLQQRPPGKRHAGLWEFPGGKVDPGETPEAALVREIEEELGLGLDLGALRPLTFASEPGEQDGRAPIVLLLFGCSRWQGTAEGREGQSFGWFTPAEASALPMPPLDCALLNWL